MKICKVGNCNKKIYAKGYCYRHYLQQWRHGEVLERTRSDPNEIIEYKDHISIILYNKNNKPIAQVKADKKFKLILSQYKWCLNSDGYAITNKNNKTISMQKIIFPNQKVDHINRNPLDNRIKNLRSCTFLENSRNRSLYKNNTSGIMGVCWDKQHQRWQAHIMIQNKSIHLGFFLHIEDAKKVRLAAEKKYFGKFAPQ